MSPMVPEHLWRDKDDLLVLADALAEWEDRQHEFGSERDALRARYMLNQVRQLIGRMP